MIRWPMHSKYLKCDNCDNVIDRRAKNDFGGRYANTLARGTFEPYNEVNELLEYAKCLGWKISDKHLCPKCN